MSPDQRKTGTSPAPSGETRVHGAPISAALALILGALVLLAVLLVIGIATWTGYRNTVDLLRQKAEIMVSAAVDRVHINLETTERQAGFLATAIASGETSPDDLENFVTLLAGTLAATPEITSIGFIDPDLNLTAVERGDPMPVPVFSRLSDDATWRALISEAATAREPYWAKVAWRDEYRTAQLSRREPVWLDGEFLGVINIEVSISSLSELIGNLESDFGMNAFILEGRQKVIAHPLLQFGFPNLTRNHPVPLVPEVGDPILMSMWDPGSLNPRVSGLLGAHNGHAIDLGDETYVFMYHAEDRYGGDWLIGSYLAASDVLKEIERLFQAIWACAGIVASALVLSAWLGRRISRPVRLLAQQARRVRELDFANTQRVPGSHIRELDEAAAAFNQMVEGLRERQMIRDLFGKYVPDAIVNELLRDKGQLAPRSVEATVLFIDIADFTMLSEGVPPQVIVDTLNAYFSGVSRIIERHGGMITQFQGDAILAVFNLPFADADHARNAVGAGLEIRRYVASHRFGGRRLTCRIGINTGEVVAGNVGARDRLSYTVHGDAVNIAARLDDLNKELGTDFLISAETARHIAGQGIELKALGETVIRGKSAFVRVFEVR